VPHPTALLGRKKKKKVYTHTYGIPFWLLPGREYIHTHIWEATAQKRRNWKTKPMLYSHWFIFFAELLFPVPSRLDHQQQGNKKRNTHRKNKKRRRKQIKTLHSHCNCCWASPASYMLAISVCCRMAACVWLRLSCHSFIELAGRPSWSCCLKWLPSGLNKIQQAQHQLKARE
jgi:hypothetical protein